MALDIRFAAQTFFSSELVIKELDPVKRKALSKAGAFVRTRARQSIKRRKGPSPAGQPPHAHHGAIKLIYFAYDRQSESVVVGPIPFQGVAPAGTVPNLLEKGAQFQRPAETILIRNATGRTEKGRFVSGGTRKIDLPARQVKYEARPFMEPALEHERPKFAEQFA